MSKYQIGVYGYVDTFKNLDTKETFYGEKVCELLEQKDDKIAELEAKLAESEKKHSLDEKEWLRYCAYKYIEPQIKGCLDREWQYKKQLADIEAQNKRVLEKLDLITRSNQELENQLAEKEKEIESFKKYISCKRCIELISKINEDKISFAIEQLEFVQKYIKQSVNNFDDMNDVLYAIDNHINKLKEK